jgi:hypothetical protein
VLSATSDRNHEELLSILSGSLCVGRKAAAYRTGVRDKRQLSAVNGQPALVHKNNMAGHTLDLAREGERRLFLVMFHLYHILFLLFYILFLLLFSFFSFCFYFTFTLVYYFFHF